MCTHVNVFKEKASSQYGGVPPLSRGVVRMYGWLYFGCVWCPLPLILECLYSEYILYGCVNTYKVAMSPLTSVFACPLGDDVPYDDSVRIHLDNQALLRSGWRHPSNSTTSC